MIIIQKYQRPLIRYLKCIKIIGYPNRRFYLKTYVECFCGGKQVLTKKVIPLE
jgi:hypothetical protein